MSDRETMTIQYADGIYEGEVKDGKPDGRGIMTYEDGAIYDGEWKNNTHHGTGTETFASGDVYVGQWAWGNPNGKGTYIWKDGNVYEGQWVEGNQHGKGILTYASGEDAGSVYEGQWMGGLQHGKGTARCPDGKVYEGEWIRGEPQEMTIRARGDRTRCNNSDGDLAGQRGELLVRGINASIANTDARSGGAQPPGKEKRVYNHERQLRSEQSRQRRFEKSTPSKQLCEHCGADDYCYKLRVCSGCNLALYCSAACQKAARRSHQRICDIVSMLPTRDSDHLALGCDNNKLVDLDAGLRYGTKYMHTLKHLKIDCTDIGNGDMKFSAKYLRSLFRSKKGKLHSVFWDANGVDYFPGNEVWKELHGLKQLCFCLVKFVDVQCLHDIIDQQRNTLMALSLQLVYIDWSKAKNRRTIAQAVNSCKHLVKLDLSGCVFTDSDLKAMLQSLPNLRIINLRRDMNESHEFTDNTCGLIARKCPGLQELNLNNHEHLSVRGLRKIFGGCVHLRSFHTSSLKLSWDDVRNLLDIAPQLLALTLGSNKSYASDGGMLNIIEATGGRTLVLFSSPRMMCDPEALSLASREKYDCQIAALGQIKRKREDPQCANEWEDYV